MPFRSGRGISLENPDPNGDADRLLRENHGRAGISRIKRQVMANFGGFGCNFVSFIASCFYTYTAMT